MHAPADKTAKRLSLEDWFVRYDAFDLLKRGTDGRAKRTAAPPPADRIAVRA
jgi:hypothetical protein